VFRRDCKFTGGLRLAAHADAFCWRMGATKNAPARFASRRRVIEHKHGSGVPPLVGRPSFVLCVCFASEADGWHLRYEAAQASHVRPSASADSSQDRLPDTFAPRRRSVPEDDDPNLPASDGCALSKARAFSCDATATRVANARRQKRRTRAGKFLERS
jgi:hypothetical protein